MEFLSNHERNIVEISHRVVEKSTSVIYNHPKEPSYVHMNKKSLIDNIKKYFVKFLKRYVETPDFLTSIRWFYTQKLLDFNNKDPILPYNIDDNEGLYHELQKINVPKNEVKILSDRVHDMITNFKPRKYDDIMKLSYNDGLYTFKYDDYNFLLVESSYNKLKYLYTGNPSDLNINIFNLICRYESLSSPGYHASIPESMSKILRDELSVSHQLFASPFNCDPEINYTSAYPDTDIYFGSKGNFLQIYPLLFENGGSFEANPPFLEEHMTILSMIIEKSLENDVPLSFFIIYPTWIDAISFRLLLNSKYNVLENKVMNFEGGKHNYTQSSQYWNRGTVRKSSSNTSIFILQNELGKSKYGITNNMLEKIHNSFKV